MNDRWVTYKELSARINMSIRNLKRIAKKESWPQKKVPGDRNKYVIPITIDDGTMTKYDKKLIAFPWYGGKFSHLEWILPLLPHDISRCHYIEPFGGSMAILINKEKSKLETYNDLNSEAVNFFRVLRKKDKREELIDMIFLTPYSREEYENIFDSPAGDDVEKAWQFYVKTRMSMHAIGNSKKQFRVNIDPVINSPATRRLRLSCPKIWEISNRILDVQIENMDAIELIKKYDSPNAFFYLDPPYKKEKRKSSNCYKHEFFDHEKMESVLGRIKGRFLLSGYGDYSSLKLKHKEIVQCKSSRFQGKTSAREELLYSNY